MFKHYLSLTKPGIIMGNLIAAAAGFFLAAKGNIDWPLFVATMTGTVLVIASGCAYNNYIDRDIDGKMQRTRGRVLVTGQVSTKNALLLASCLGVAGFTLLLLATSWSAFVAAVGGFTVYVGLYSLAYKRTSIHGTAIGSLSGACPPVIGYLAVSNQFDSGALILLATFCLWQIPHSYAIAIYRLDDYAKANIPVLPVREGIKSARFHIIAYILAFVIVSLLLAQQNYAGLIYAIAMAVLGLYWAYIAIIEYCENNHRAWGKKLFVFSIITICCFSLLISVDFIPEAHIVTLAFQP